MYLLIALLACGGDDTTSPTDAPQIEANAGPNATPDAAAPGVQAGGQTRQGGVRHRPVQGAR